MFVPPVQHEECQHFSAAEPMRICTWLNLLDAKAVQSRVSRCKGSAVKSVTIPIRPGDVIAGGAGGMGPCPAPQHQPPGNGNYTYIPDI